VGRAWPGNVDAGRADWEEIAMGLDRGNRSERETTGDRIKVSCVRMASIVWLLCVRRWRRSIARAMARISVILDNVRSVVYFGYSEPIQLCR
jgi:hypothetical protein